MGLGSRVVIKRHVLEELAEQRLVDFEALVSQGRYAAAIYLGVYSVECLLKAHFCKTLDLDELPETYKGHHLTTLLLHSGLYKRIQNAPRVYESLKKLDGIWNPADEQRNIRYIHDPLRYDQAAALDVGRWMTDTQDGVITWLRSQL